MQDRITLTDVKQAFEQWRADKLHPTERTPKHLRRMVEAIAPYYPRRQIITSLAITADQMSRFIRDKKDIDAVSHPFNDMPSNEFIELPIPVLSKIKHALIPSATLTITRSDGASWAVSEASLDIITESLHLFLRG